MRKMFSHFYSPTETQLDELWKNALIALDANVLLNLYRYSPQTREQLLQLFERGRERLWLPHQAALEFHTNRPGVIATETKKYDDLLADFQQLLNSLDRQTGHPFASRHVRRQLQSAFDLLKTDFAQTTELMAKYWTADAILDRVSSVFDGRIGPAFTDEQIASLHNVGVDRYKRKIPPGFEDSDKPDQRKFGDLILWTQIVQEAKKRSCPVIFVTDDAKADWWREHAGKTLGPHPALKQEICDGSGKPFHMYQTFRFLEYASQYLGTQITDRTIREVKAAQYDYQLREAEMSAALNRAKRAFADANSKLVDSRSKRASHEKDLAELAEQYKKVSSFMQSPEFATRDERTKREFTLMADNLRLRLAPIELLVEAMRDQERDLQRSADAARTEYEKAAAIILAGDRSTNIASS